MMNNFRVMMVLGALLLAGAPAVSCAESGGQEEKLCCKMFNSSSWNEKEITWNNKLFVKDRVRSVLHVPLNFRQVIDRTMKRLQLSGAKNTDDLILSDENSLWGADVYIAVDREIPGAAMTKLSGRFMTKVFNGPYSNMKGYIEEMRVFVGSKNKEIKKMYFFYTTCPRCAKVYGTNYIVIFAQIN